MQESIKDPRHNLLSNIDLQRSRVEFSNTPIVLLCGGEVTPPKNHPEDPAPPWASLRDAISRSVISRFDIAYEIFRPEELKSWQADGIYKNLMTFEADLASICSLVVIFLESAGSIAELGAFSQLPDLSKKIIAIRSREFTDDSSFINLGILRFIAENHSSGVKSYPWNIKDPTTITNDIINDVISDINDELVKIKKSETINLKQDSHVIIIICEIISLFTAVKENEVLEFLNLIGASLTLSRLKSKLFLLEKFNLIKKEEYSDAVFYMRSQEPYHRIRLSLKGDGHSDHLRIQMMCTEYYSKDSKHKNRVRAIAQANKQNQG